MGGFPVMLTRDLPALLGAYGLDLNLCEKRNVGVPGIERGRKALRSLHCNVIAALLPARAIRKPPSRRPRQCVAPCSVRQVGASTRARWDSTRSHTQGWLRAHKFGLGGQA